MNRVRENRWLCLLVGALEVGLLVLIPLVGRVVDGLVLLLGLGAITRLAYRTYRRTERGEESTVAEGTAIDTG